MVAVMLKNFRWGLILTLLVAVFVLYLENAKTHRLLEDAKTKIDYYKYEQNTLLESIISEREAVQEMRKTAGELQINSDANTQILEDLMRTRPAVDCLHQVVPLEIFKLYGGSKWEK